MLPMLSTSGEGHPDGSCATPGSTPARDLHVETTGYEDVSAPAPTRWTARTSDVDVDVDVDVRLA